MPIATVQLPNGKIADIEVPQGATPQEIESFVMNSPELGGQQEMQPQAQPMQSPEELSKIARKQAYLKENLPAYLKENLPATQGIAGLETIENAGRGLNLGFGNALVGGFQAATDVGEKAARLIEKIYYGDNLKMSTIGSRLADEVEQTKALQAELPLAQRIGIAIGEAVPYLTTGVGTGAKVAQVAGKVAGLATGGAIGGAVSSAFSPQEQAGLENRAIETLKGGAIGATVGAGLGIAGKAVNALGSGATQLGRDILAGYKAKPTEAIAGFTSKPVETLDSISEAIKEGSSNAYKAMRESGAILKPETTKSIFMNIDDSLKESGILNPRLHGDTIGVLEDLKALAKEKNGAIGLEELDQYRQLLGDVVKKNTDIGGKINSDALKANIAINKLDDVVENLGGNALQGIMKPNANVSLKIRDNNASIFKDNKEVGSINFSDDNGIIKIKRSDVATPKQGIGFEAYKQFIDKQLSAGKIIYSDADLTAPARKIYDKLEAAGYKVEKSPNAFKMINDRLTTVPREERLAQVRNFKGMTGNLVGDPLYKITAAPQSVGNQKTLDLLNTARSEWKRYRKFDAITNIVRKADGDPNRIKTLLQNFVNNPKNLRGFLPAEVEALKRAKTNSTAEGLMKAVGKFGFDIGSGRNAGNSALPIGSILIGGGTGGITAMVGTIARQAQKLSARGQIDDVLKLIQGQEPQVASKVVQKLPAKTRDYVLTNILTQTINQ